VLPIGGLKEKLLAALRAGIKTVVIPEENVKDLAEIGDEVKAPLEIIAASRMDDVLKVALLRMPTPSPSRRRPPRGRRRGQGRAAHHGALTVGCVLEVEWRAERRDRAQPSSDAFPSARSGAVMRHDVDA
jgi:hypothetical protein